MDLSAIIVVVVLVSLFFGAAIWLEIRSRRMQRRKASADIRDSDAEGNNAARRVARNSNAECKDLDAPLVNTLT